MALIRWDPWSEMMSFQRGMQELVRRVFAEVGLSSRPLGASPAWLPAVDVFARKGDLVVRAELPGIDPEKDVDISVQEGVLKIRGERRLEERDESGSWFRAETSYGAFERQILLPEGVKPEDIEASYDRGILEVVVPKAGQLAPARKIPVQVRGSRKALAAKARKRARI